MNAASHPVQSLLDGDVALGATVLVRGWLRSRRTSKAGISFLAVHDGSGFDPIQAVAPEALDNYEEIAQLGTGAAVEVEGTLVESRGQGQAVEIQASRVRVLGPVTDPEHYPIAKKRHTFEYLRGVAHLRPRTNTIGAIARLRHHVARAVHDFFDREGFFWVNTPLVTAADAEGAGELFRVSTLDPGAPPTNVDGAVDWSRDFFGKPTFLTVSGQLNVEAYCMALGKVYTFGPTFRAENSHTSRHLAEFWMVEPEIAFADLDDLAALAERFLKAVIRTTLNRCERDMRFFVERVDPQAVARLEAVERTPFTRMTYTDAVAVLERSGQDFDFPVAWGRDLQSEHERYLCETHVGGPVVVTDYPEAIKAFYMRRNDDGRTVAAMDVLVPGVGEIIGGSQREERLEVLEPRMQQMGIATELDWYLDLRRYGTAEHAGFGLGLERLLLYFSGMENIRDVIPFPRVPGNADF